MSDYVADVGITTGMSMQIEDIASFAVLCLALSISPGPDSVLVIKLALERRLLG